MRAKSLITLILQANETELLDANRKRRAFQVFKYGMKTSVQRTQMTDFLVLVEGSVKLINH